MSGRGKAPKEKRTLCTADGETIEIPNHAKGPKGATEGPCEETPTGPDPAAAQACADMGGQMITDTRCAVTYQDAQIPLTYAYLIGDLTKYYERDGTQFVGVLEQDFVVKGCVSQIGAGYPVPLWDSTCYDPVYNPQT